MPNYIEIKFNSLSQSKFFEAHLENRNIPVTNMYSLFNKVKISDIFYSGLPGYYSIYGYNLIAQEVKNKLLNEK